jgi:hypothetical protein
MTRGPEAILAKGSSVEMVLDRPLTYQDTDLDFSKAPPTAPISEGGANAPQRRGWNSRIPLF